MQKLRRGYVAEQQKDYTAGLAECESVADLRALVDEFKPLALDAYEAVHRMTDADWPEWQRGLKSERRGKFAGEAWLKRFGAILLPMPMLNVAMIADQYKVPFGCAWMRCEELRPDLLKPPFGADGPSQEQG